MSYIFSGRLHGQIALVTGASRGVGKGVATMLVQAGATVYITGRENSAGSCNVKQVAETLNELAEGECKYVFCDHSKDDQVDALFELISQKHEGRLDILVNNAFSGVPEIGKYIKKKFYEIDYRYWDSMNIVGLRSSYVCSVLASRMMVKNQSGLIVNISSAGALIPIYGVAYGVNKEGTDRMSQEMSLQLKNHGVTVVSMWPGAVETETISELIKKNPAGRLASQWKHSEDPTLTGKAVVAFAFDREKIKKTGKVLIVAELAHHYGFNDINGNVPISLRSLKYLFDYFMPSLSWLAPEFLKVPGWLLYAYYSRF